MALTCCTPFVVAACCLCAPAGDEHNRDLFRIKSGPFVDNKNNLRQHGSQPLRTSAAPETNSISRDKAAGRGLVGLPAAAVAATGTSHCVAVKPWQTWSISTVQAGCPCICPAGLLLRLRQDAVFASDLSPSSAYRGWLAHNAVLLDSLTLPDWQVSEDCIAAGLQAAAAHGRSSASVPPAAPCSGLLPLQSLTCNIPTRGDILHSLSGAAQLTSLWLRVAVESPEPGCQAALAGLTSLQHLTLGMDSDNLGQTGDVFQEWLPGLAKPTRLTYVNLSPRIEAGCCSGGRAIHAACFMGGTGHKLPTSLMQVEMEIAGDSNTFSNAP